MSAVGIVTDSTSCLPNDLLSKYRIGLVPMGIVINGRVYQDQIGMMSKIFWQEFREEATPITTAPISPGEFYAKFIEMGQVTRDIICILVSKTLTASHKAAESGRAIAMDKNPRLNIQIIDSKTSTGALGYIVLEAARAAQQNKSFDEVTQVVNNMIPRVKYVSMMETMKYMIRLGRAPKDAEAGESLGIKPLTGMVRGTGLVESLGGVPGKEKGMIRLVDMIKEYADTTKALHVMIHYSDRVSDGEKLKEMVIDKYKVKELYMTPYTPAMACHTGSILAIAFYSEI
jgi:DegV family protein with EDD domain